MTATLLVILLIGSVTAGVFFASPLRRRLASRLSVHSSSRPRPASADADPLRSKALRPLAAAALRLRQPVDALLDRIGQLVASRAKRFGAGNGQPPLPPMLGGDIFFDDEPPARRGVRPLDKPQRANSTAEGPWSTAPVTNDSNGPDGQPPADVRL